MQRILDKKMHSSQKVAFSLQKNVIFIEEFHYVNRLLTKNYTWSIESDYPYLVIKEMQFLNII